MEVQGRIPNKAVVSREEVGAVNGLWEWIQDKYALNLNCSLESSLT